MTSIALTDQGLVTQTQQELYDELVARLRAKYGVNLKVDPKSGMGQFANILTELRALDHQAMLALWSSFDPNGAKGESLSRSLTFTGSTRKGATRSFVNGTLTFSGAGTMSNGDRIRNDDTGDLWELTDGPKTLASAGTIAAQMTAVETGPLLAQAGTTWSTVTVVPNLVGFTNPSDDATVGRDQEQDGAARARRLVELYSQGQGPLAAIEGAVSQVENVEFVRVYHNPTTSPADSDGIPFKAFNVVVETQPSTPGTALRQAIIDAIWIVHGAGGEAYGTDYVGEAIDSEGNNHAVAFDTISIRDVNLGVELVTSTSEDPITPNITDVVKAEILATAQAEHAKVGRDVKALDYEGVVARMLEAGTISGVDDVNVTMSLDADPLAAVAKLAVSIRERPDFDSANLAVTTA